MEKGRQFIEVVISLLAALCFLFLTYYSFAVTITIFKKRFLNIIKFDFTMYQDEDNKKVVIKLLLRGAILMVLFILLLGSLNFVKHGTFGWYGD